MWQPFIVMESKRLILQSSVVSALPPWISITRILFQSVFEESMLVKLIYH